MCLLTVLNDLKNVFKEKYDIEYDLVVAHVNHGIRKESESEKVYVQDKCNELKIPFYYLKEEVEKIAQKNKMSVEACGRKIRYDFFDKIKSETDSNKIAVAHNLDDNVETILLNLIRGCGIKGLIGMQYMFKDIIRPLLTIEKKDILEYNVFQNLNPCFDSTNNENVYVRNKVRNLLIPLLKNEYNSNFVNNIIRMKNILSEDENFLEEYTNNTFYKSIIENNKNRILFNTKYIINVHTAISNRCIMKIIELKIGNLDGIENVHVNDIVKLLKNNIKGKKYIIGNKFTIEILDKYKAAIY